MRKSRKDPVVLPSLRKYLPDIFDLPENVYKDVCQIELVSDSVVSIDGSGALLTFSEEAVSLRVEDRILLIEGTKLTLHGMDEDRLVVKGKILSLRYV